MKLRLPGLTALVLLLAWGTRLLWNHPNAVVGTRPEGGADVPCAQDARAARDESAGPFRAGVSYRPHQMALDPGGFGAVMFVIRPWKDDATLRQIAERWDRPGYRGIEAVDRSLADPKVSQTDGFLLRCAKVNLLGYEGEAKQAYQLLGQLRSYAESDDRLASSAMASLVYLQGIMALRRGEDDNCLMCRGESACILPIVPAAVHTDPTGSRLAIRHLTEYLARFPDSLEVRWLLNLAHMTLGEYPDRVDPRYRLDLSPFFRSEYDIGRFRDVSHSVGLGDRLNRSGGAIMDDFDGDGLLDIVVTSSDPTQAMAFYRNRGDGTFEDRTTDAGLAEQLGGLVCFQADYDNDGRLDVFIPRGAWHAWPMRPTLLHNRGGGRFADVTQQAGLAPCNSNAAAWADYDNDGDVDLFVACERQPNRLYRNKGDGTFEDVAAGAGLLGAQERYAKGCAWLDYDNDGFPDLFVNNGREYGRLYHNERDGRFAEVTTSAGIDGPRAGFSCWSWDYDNDGWLDLFAVGYSDQIEEVLPGMLGRLSDRAANRLYRNLQGKGFEDVTEAAGLDAPFAAMGSNYADFDNDGFLDMYLGTGAPGIGFLVPNRMFKNVDGRRFADISSSSRTGHLQKGHAVACGDWDRDGDVDLFVETGGAVNGDKYHNLLFQNPGQGNHWLTIRLVGTRTNRSAIGARIKVITAGERPSTIHRHVSSGSSFGGNALEQTIGLGRAGRVALLEIRWPTSGTTQVLRDLDSDQAIEVTEQAEGYRKLDSKPTPAPR
jgi:FG-GAP-like repeat/ASPIC and UnbV